MKKKLQTFEDIMFEYPWTCGSKDCHYQWHKSTYWWNQKGKKTFYTIDNYSDGDQEPILKKDIPSMKEYDKAWKEYNEYVARTGCDPLNSFDGPEPKKITHQLQALVRQGVDRILLKGFRKKGKLSPWQIKSIPGYVKDYLDLERINSRAPWVLNGFKNLIEMRKLVKEAMQGDKVTIRTPKEAVVDFKTIEVLPTKASEIKAHLKAAAQRALLK